MQEVKSEYCFVCHRQVNRHWHVYGVRLQKVPTPKIRIDIPVKTDGFVSRIVTQKELLTSIADFGKHLSENLCINDYVVGGTKDLSRKYQYQAGTIQ